jgi:hypothetical protein
MWRLAHQLHGRSLAGARCVNLVRSIKNGDIVQDLLSENIEVLRARADRFRRLAKDFFDPSISEAAVSLAEELDAEIARLLRGPKPITISIRRH